ncbi:uncharacterized protein [Typha latifolia]|uniref:uncharacterized protein n=1 Tax=Typha latifolia TaxID=4733 RepID=UPI003C2DDABD
MIHLCACTGGSPSSLENPSHRDGPKSCKSCGGKLIVDGREALPGNMLSTVKLELSRIIDPHLNWKTATKGRQRTVRRARTSFTGESEKNSIKNALNWTENCTDRESNRMGDIPVSESEKLGVSILGRRFSDALGSVPIKKRRFLLVRSPSPPPHSSHSNESDNILEGHSASYGESALYAKHHQERLVANGSASLNDINGELCCGEDFSGISILAAAACDSGTEGDSHITNTDLASKGHSFQEEKLLHCSEEFPCKSDMPLGISSTTVLPAKGLGGDQVDGSNCPSNSTGPLQDVSKKTRAVECSSRDSRFHWDLNTVWDSNGDEEVANSEPCAAGIVGEDVDHGHKIEKFETFQDSGEHCEMKDAPVPSDAVVCIAKDSSELHDTKAHEKCDMFVDDSVTDHNNGKEDHPLACGNSLGRKVHHFEDTSSLRGSTDEIKEFQNQQKGGCEAETESSLFRGASDPVTEPYSPSSAMKKVKFDAFSVSRMESERTSDQAINKQVFVESTNQSIVDVSNKSPAASDINGVPMEQAMQPRNCKVEKNLTTDSGNEESDHCRSVGLLVENASYKLSDGNICTDVTVAVGDSEPVQSDGFKETEDANIEKSKEADICSCLSDSRPYNSQASCNHDGSSSGSTDGRKQETISEDMKVDDNKDAIRISCGNTSEAKTDAPGKVPLDHFDWGCDSNASQLDIDQADGMEKVDLEDNDSQYEDGELREYVQNSWREEGFEEDEPEQVDYGSDNRESDFFEVASDIPTSVSLPDTVPKKNGGSLGASNDGAQAVQKDSHSAGLQAELKCSSVSIILDVKSGRSGMRGSSGKDSSRNLRVKDECRKSEKSVKNMLETGSGNNAFPNGGGGSRDISVGSRMKSSGWDRLPEGRRTSRHGSRDARLDSVKQNGTSISLDVEGSGDSLRKMGSSLRRELSSRIEWPKSSDGSHRNDKSYVESSRSDDSLSLKGERELGGRRSSGRGGSSHTQGRGRGEQWVELPTHSDPTRHGSPGYYGPSTFAHPGSRNATAAAVAKVESNGFVVAPDGTIVKAGGVGTAGRVPRRSANVSLHSTRRPLSGRGSPTERDGACGMHGGLRRAREISPDWHFGVGQGRSSQYGNGITRDHYRRPISDDGIDPLLVRHSLSRRQRSFSPCRGLHLSRSHTRSRSRSRTRSPHLWASPSKSDIRMTRGSNFHRHSRSPNLKSEGRTERATSPQRRSGFENRMVGYGPSLRNRTSSPHSSRWVDERKDSLDHLWEHDYKQFSERSPPSRAFSQSNRFDLLDSSGRLKHDDYYRPIHSSRFPGYVGLSRGSRHDRSGDDRRDHGDRYGLLHSVRHYVTNDNDDSDHFRTRDSAVKSSKFQARGSPRVFDRGIESQLGDSSNRAKEEKGHFRYGKSGKHNTT